MTETHREASARRDGGVGRGRDGRTIAAPARRWAWSAASIAALVFGACAAANAQETTRPATPAADKAAVGASARASADNTSDEVIVTAEKKKDTLLNVPINVTSISAETLRNSRVSAATDLVAHVANVDVKTNIPGAQQIISVRGVGLDDFSSTNNSSVGIYVDDVFLASFAEMDFNFYDLQRVEVLKGPQGTLYGRNSTAGAINVISARPSTARFEGAATAGYGNFDAFDAEAHVNIPVSPTLALRFSGKTLQQGEGYWRSRVLNADLGRQDIFLGRGQALWTPTSKVTALLKIEGERNRSEIGVGKMFGTIPTTAAPCPDFSNPGHCVNLHGYTDVSGDKFTGDWNHAAPYRVDQANATLHVDADLGWATLSSVTGYIDFKRRFYIDADASPTRDAEFDQNDKVNQFSQELRLSGLTKGAEWLVGGYISHDRVQTRTPGNLEDFLGLDALILADQTTRTAAAFGQVKWPIADHLSLTTGARYTYEDRAYVGGTTLLFSGSPVGATAQDDKIFDRNWSWRASLDWKPHSGTLVYGSVSRGTKSGGFFNGITTVDAALAPYLPEQLTDYELGVKSQMLDRALLLDASVFYYDYNDLQAQTFTNVGAVSLIKLSNIPSATIYGADVGATWRPMDGLTLRGGLGLLHTELGSFQTANAGGVVIVPKGNKLPDAPDATLNLEGRYEFALSGGYRAALQLDGHYSSKVFKEALNTPYLSADSYWLANARASVMTAGNDWEVALWAKNLFDTRYVAQATDDGIGVGYRVFNAPRTFGLSVSHKFGG